MGLLHGSRVKIRGHMIAHRTTLSPRTNVEEIWFGDRIWRSDSSDINRYQTGSSTEPLRPPSWKIDMTSNTSYFCRMKFDILMQNNMLITVMQSKSKPERELQYGRSLYFQNGSSYISALNWDMSTELDFQIDFDLLNTVTSTNRKVEVVLSRRGRHLET